MITLFNLFQQIESRSQQNQNKETLDNRKPIMAKKRVPDWLNSPMWSSPTEQNRFSATPYPSEPPSPPPVTVVEDPPSNHNAITTSPPSSSSSSASTSSADDMSISRLAQSQSQLLAELSRKVIDMRELRRIASQGIPDSPGLRSTIWKLLLGYLPPDRALWSSELAKKRSQYKRFKQDILINPLVRNHEEDVQLC